MCKHTTSLRYFICLPKQVQRKWVGRELFGMVWGSEGYDGAKGYGGAVDTEVRGSVSCRDKGIGKAL